MWIGMIGARLPDFMWVSVYDAGHLGQVRLGSSECIAIQPNRPCLFIALKNWTFNLRSLVISVVVSATACSTEFQWALISQSNERDFWVKQLDGGCCVETICSNWKQEMTIEIDTMWRQPVPSTLIVDFNYERRRWLSIITVITLAEVRCVKMKKRID